MRIRIRFQTASKARALMGTASAPDSRKNGVSTTREKDTADSPDSGAAYLQPAKPADLGAAYLREDLAAEPKVEAPVPVPAKEEARPRTHGAIYMAYNRRVALAAASLLTAAALMAGVLGLWRIGADLKWTSNFAISSGLFSHWQVWLGAAFLLEVCAHFLNRYGNGGDRAVS